MMPGFAWLAGGTALLAGAWRWVQSIWARFVSLVVVKATLSGEVHTAVLEWCWAELKPLPSVSYSYHGESMFVRPLNRSAVVAYETLGGKRTFFHGWKPFFLSQADEGSSTPNAPTDTNKSCTITFLRGTFNLDELISNAVERYDQRLHSNKTTGIRFSVTKYFARENNNTEVTPAKSIQDATSLQSKRLLKYDHKEIGQQTSKEPFSHLHYKAEILEFLSHIRVWYGAQKWYNLRKIPWRLSALLKGPPGTGKTSYVRAVGQELDLPVHIIDVAGMTNNEFNNAWKNALYSTPSIVLLEDFDRIDFTPNQMAQNKLTMDCVLNCISGVESSDGVLLFVTANDETKLDCALLRPGRLDRHLLLGELTVQGRQAVAARILEGCDVDQVAIVAAGESETGAQFEFRAQEAALRSFWQNLT